MRYLILFCICLIPWVQCEESPAPPSFCSCPKQLPILYDLRLQCPLFFQPNPPLQVSGDILDKALASKGRTEYSSVLFYASWCPFSKNGRLTFDVLSSMYPQIEHFAVEQSTAMPSLFSRYGIHSLPAILVVNQTSQMRFHGSKDLASLINFYKQITGLEPIQYIALDQSGSLATGGNSIMQSWIGASVDEIRRREPYLIFSVLFLLLRVVLYIFPKVLNHFRAIWVSYQPHLNLELFGEACQILGRILHLIDVKRVWTKLKLCKNRKFHRGARNARVWASSLASVSLGKTSTSRLSS